MWVHVGTCGYISTVHHKPQDSTTHPCRRLRSCPRPAPPPPRRWPAPAPGGTTCHGSSPRRGARRCTARGSSRRSAHSTQHSRYVRTNTHSKSLPLWRCTCAAYHCEAPIRLWHAAQADTWPPHARGASNTQPCAGGTAAISHLRHNVRKELDHHPADCTAIERAGRGSCSVRPSMARDATQGW